MVIAIIAVLVALLVPAVQSSRESARRTSCGNNLRQIATAALAYESSMGQLPPGIVESPMMQVGGGTPATGGVGPGHTAFTYLLPWVEQLSVYQQYQFGRRDIDPVQNTATSSPIPTYRCPSDDAAGRWAIHTYNSVRYSRSNYVFSMGSNTMIRNSLGNFVLFVYPGSRTGAWNGTNDGPFWFAATGRRTASFRDGLSQTAFFSEVRSGHSESFDAARLWDVRGLWAWHMAGASAYTHLNTPNSSVGDALYAFPGQDVECVAGPNMPCDNTAGVASDRHQAAARSCHPGGVQVAFLDGRVAFYIDTVDAALWRAIGSAAGGEAISAE
ncbi:MAG: DUF1559 domain-containing protein [Planctomycetia bacterium]|nr:DUF1559 domain-containing protein [Planctomycetia bacterium]